MNQVDYINECMKKLNVSTTYQLAKKLNLVEREVNYCMKNERLANDFMCFKIAECLEIDPALVIANIRAEGETNPMKKAYFRSFPGALRKAGVVIILALALSLSLLNAPAVGDPAGSAALMAGGLLFLYLLYFA